MGALLPWYWCWSSTPCTSGWSERSTTLWLKLQISFFRCPRVVNESSVLLLCWAVLDMTVTSPSLTLLWNPFMVSSNEKTSLLHCFYFCCYCCSCGLRHLFVFIDADSKLMKHQNIIDPKHLLVPCQPHGRNRPRKKSAAFLTEILFSVYSPTVSTLWKIVRKIWITV